MEGDARRPCRRAECRRFTADSPPIYRRGGVGGGWRRGTESQRCRRSPCRQEQCRRRSASPISLSLVLFVLRHLSVPRPSRVSHSLRLQGRWRRGGTESHRQGGTDSHRQNVDCLARSLGQSDGRTKGGGRSAGLSSEAFRLNACGRREGDLPASGGQTASFPQLDWKNWNSQMTLRSNHSFVDPLLLLPSVPHRHTSSLCMKSKGRGQSLRNVGV